MALIKHIAIKNVSYSDALAYLKFEHDEFTNKPILDENGEKTTEVTDKPYMRTTYETVRRDPSELDEYDLPKYQALMKIKNAVLALI